MIYTKIPHILKTLRTKNKMTLAELSEASGVKLSLLQHYESGRVHPPMKKLETVLEVYGYEVRIEEKEN